MIIIDQSHLSLIFTTHQQLLLSKVCEQAAQNLFVGLGRCLGAGQEGLEFC